MRVSQVLLCVLYAGWRGVSALELISQPENAHIWDGFRNIDADKESRVLQVG
jgi:hypothetical protein